MSEIGVKPIPPNLRSSGLRFSTTDALILTLSAAAAWLLRNNVPDVAGLLLIVVLHFLLFCNVFRIDRKLELIWAGTLLVNALVWSLADNFGWRAILVTQLPLTILLIGIELRSPRYHGIAARWINRRHLNAWLTGEIDAQDNPH